MLITPKDMKDWQVGTLKSGITAQIANADAKEFGFKTIEEIDMRLWLKS